MGKGKVAVYHVEGMTCGACAVAIETELKRVKGVKDVTVSLATNECRVEFDGQQVEQPALKGAIMDCGFDATLAKQQQEVPSLQEQSSAVFSVQHMTCGACVATITQNISAERGVLEVDVSLATEECRVVFVPEMITPAQIKEIIDDSGFEAEIINGAVATESQSSQVRQASLKVLGMTCGSCVSTVESTLVEMPGVLSVQVSLATEEAEMQYDSSIIGIRDMARKIEELGFESAAVNSYDNTAQVKQLAKVREIFFWKHTCVRACLSMVFMLLLYKFIPRLSPKVRSWALYQQSPIPGLFYRDIVGFMVTCYVQFWVGRHFYKAGFKSIKHGSGSMDTIVLLSTLCSFAFSLYSIANNIIKKSDKLPNVVFDASTMLIGFISVGKLLENKAKSRTNTSLSKLISLAPSTCTIIENGEPREIPVEYLQVGDVVEIKPGARLPTDGVIIQGESEIDESLITGESLMVPRYKGSPVIAGSINGPNHFLFTATSVGDDTKLSHIIQTMKQAQLNKALIQRYADYLASKFVPTILMLALITFATWLVLSHVLSQPPAIFNDPNGKFFVCLEMTISVIVVACPCALGLAAPTAIMVGTGLGARHGVLIKGGDILEKCNTLDTFLFDKTGTLTTGHMTVHRYCAMGNSSSLSTEQLLCINAAEAVSEHPVAKALVDYTSQQLAGCSKTAIVTKSQVVLGGGLICDCELDGKSYHVVIGNKNVLQRESLPSASNNTVAYVEIDGEVIGRFEITDLIKKDAAEVVKYLQEKGHRVCMVTGDNRDSALKAAGELGIESSNVFSELTPTGKNQLVRDLQEGSGQNVAFVGDGINDSPALVTSDLGVSISTGTDIAMEAADLIILSRSDHENATLRELVYALDIAQKTFRRVKINFFWALCYNLFMLPIAMGVLVPWNITLDPIVAVACMAASSVSVVGSSLLLNSWKPPALEVSANTGNRSMWSSLAKVFRGRHGAQSDDIELQAGLIPHAASSNSLEE